MLLNPKEITRKPESAIFFLIVSFNYLEIYFKVKELAEQVFYPVHLESPSLPRWREEFTERIGNSFGEETRILSFKRRINRDELPELKKKAIKIQKKLEAKDYSLKLIPGYLTSHNVVISSSYDDFHRIYLFQGVFAEIVYKYERLDLIPTDSSPEFFSMKDVHYFFTALRDFHIANLRK
ncbi:MAG: DUF4416 family protein [Leptospiraceae bacterium]|nr:DUF4416 family protein [Leptospiraceae bacterium]